MIHLITYGVKRFEKSKKRLRKEALETKWFDSVTAYGLEDLDDSFKTHFKDILNKPRGAGYWIWKSHIINKKLKEISENDLLVYLDAGCTINKLGKKRFEEYVDILNNSEEGIISFQLGHTEKVWTTREIFEHFNVDANGKVANGNQLVGGVLIMKKNKNLINMIDAEIEAFHANPLLFTDHYNGNQASYFKDNRHDQSVFSVIRKIHNPILLKDETYCIPFGGKNSLKYPFWATRIGG